MPSKNLIITEDDLQKLIQRTKDKVASQYANQIDFNPIFKSLIDTLTSQIKQLSSQKPEVIYVDRPVVVKETEIKEVDKQVVVEKPTVKEVEKQVVVTKEVPKIIYVDKIVEKEVTKGPPSQNSWSKLNVVYDGIGRAIGFEKVYDEVNEDT